MDILNNLSKEFPQTAMPCSIERNYLIQLNNTKPYMILSSHLLQHILNTKNLTSKASSIWLALYSLSSIKSNYSITIPMCQITTITNISKRSICRAIAELRQKGYLYVQSIHIKRSRWPVNNYTLVIPKEIFDDLDKKIKNRNENTHKVYKNEKYSSRSANNEYIKMCESGEIDSIHPIMKEKILTNTKFGTLFINKKYYLYTQYRDCEILNQTLIDKSDSEIKIHEKLLDGLKNELSQRQKLFEDEPHSLENPTKKFNLLKACSVTSSYIEQVNGHIEYCRTQILKERMRFSCLKSINEDDLFVFDKKIGRDIPKGLLWWAKKKLFSFGFNKLCIPRLLNEIVYAVKKGSLSKMKYSFHDMPVMKSVNIALKLVKEGKWQTPVSFKNGEVLLIK